MEIITADEMGMCFGVRDALRVADRLAAPDEVTIHGELVHNARVLDQLRARGFTVTAEAEPRPLPAGERVLVTAHGISTRERRRLRDAGKTLIDTTCPLVARAHRAAVDLARTCDHVVVIGIPGHVEVRGLTEDLPSCDVVERAEDARDYDVISLGILCQTTFPSARAAAIRTAIVAHNPRAAVQFVDTICSPTKERIRAAEKLARTADVVVVVGGHNSNNTRELAQLCRDHGARVVHVQDVTDLQPAMFAGCATAGITAGTSVLDETVAAVASALRAM